MVQPAFLFGGQTSAAAAANFKIISTVPNIDKSHENWGYLNETGTTSIGAYLQTNTIHAYSQTDKQYLIGLTIALSCAFTAALSLVLASKAKHCSRHLIICH